MRATGQSGLAILAVLLLACSSRTLGDTGTGGGGGAVTGEGGVGSIACGGSIGTGGSTGAGGSTGTGGTGDSELPDCVKALLASCATNGACVPARPDASAASDVCFASGVRASFSDPAIGTQVVRVTKADGSPCYSFETTEVPSSDLQTRLYTWKNSVGQVVATGRSVSIDAMGGADVTCACGGQTSCNFSYVPGGPPAPCCTINKFGNATCAGPFCPAGSCP